MTRRRLSGITLRRRARAIRSQHPAAPGYLARGVRHSRGARGRRCVGYTTGSLLAHTQRIRTVRLHILPNILPSVQRIRPIRLRILAHSLPGVQRITGRFFSNTFPSRDWWS